MSHSTIHLKTHTYAKAKALAAANFPKSSGAGNVTALIDALVTRAYMLPESFDLVAPGAEKPKERPTVNEELGETGDLAGPSGIHGG